MKRVLVLSASLFALVTAAPLAEAKAPAAPKPVAAARTAKAAAIAPVNYRHRVLANGLEVYTVEDSSTPNVSVQVWYKVGSKDDPASRSGFAHLFEHMMFKATRNLPAETFDRLTEDVGGFNNASTNDDYTDYFETVPANYLKTILWAEAERMGALVVDEANFKSERDVVKEELRQRVLAQPYGKLFYLLYPEISFSTAPYGRPGIGSIEDLDSATVEDVRAFHATYYRPDNAVLVVVGRFDQKQTDAWIDDFFGKVKKPDRPLPRVTVTEPARTAPKTWTTYEPNTPLPAVMMSFPFPAASSPDIPALIVADAILSKGESSRLYQSLVYKQQLAQEAFTFMELRQQPGAYGVAAILSDGKTADQGEAALRAELARLRDGQVTPAELSEAKNELITGTLRERETVGGKASELANAVVIYGDASKVNRLIPDIQKVTAADVQRVARKYLIDDQRAVIRYLSDADKPANAPSYGPAPTIKAAALTSPAGVEVVQLAPEGQRVAPPAPGEPVDITVPKPAEKRLANGLRVIVSPDRDLPLASVQLVVDAGAAADPAGLPGEALMTAALLTKGTKTRSATQIAREVEALGGELDGAAGYDASTLTLTVKRDQLDKALAVFADVARNPTFAQEELDRQRQQALNDLQVTLKDPGSLAGYAAARAVYGGAPYGEVAGGTKTSLAKLGRADVAGFHRTWFRPDRATLVITGDVTPEQGFAAAQRLFGDWKAQGSAAPASASPAGTPPAPRVIVIDLPKSGQAAVAVTRAALPRKDARYYQAVVANNVLGGGYSARLNQEIRIKRGLSYGANSRIQFRREAGPLVASTQTKNQSAPEVVDLLVTEMKKLGQAPVGAEELKARKAVVVGNFGRTVETTEDMAGLIGGLALYQVDLGEIGRYTDRVKAVTPDEVRAVGAEVFSPDVASIVVVGDASVFLPQLKAKYPNVEVIPVDQLDLDTPALRRTR
jgi:zinc protease